MRPLIAGLAVLLLPMPASAAPRTHVVVIDKMKFSPVPAAVRPGDTIIWVNKDMFRHSATARNGSFNVDLPPNSRAKTVMRAKGAFAFYCKYHPAMTGVLKVGG
ncbi:MAG TPA: cupredoxin domain-containing protein [Sphingomicrobium sp.]|jgi:plastocyanin|nr:cupredoxin domain-containing protein [Sphingomicrobium sp.]